LALLFNLLPTTVAASTPLVVWLWLQQAQRPGVEDMERLLSTRPFFRECNLVVKDFQFSRTCAFKHREMKAKEDGIRARERALAEREAAVAERERRLQGGRSPLVSGLGIGAPQYTRTYAPVCMHTVFVRR
jgi:hypothetical protein